MDNHNGSIPLINEFMGRIRITALYSFIIFFPERASQIPVGKPKLIGFNILLFQIKYSVVGNKSLKTTIVMARKPVNGKSAIGCTYCAKPVFIDKRFFFQ